MLGRLKIDPYFCEQPAEPLTANAYSKIALSELTHIGSLGCGGFGQVDLVQTPNNELLALKMLSKATIIDHSQERHVISEKNVLARLSNAFCISMCSAFTDDRSATTCTLSALITLRSLTMMVLPFSRQVRVSVDGCMLGWRTVEPPTDRWTF